MDEPVGEHVDIARAKRVAGDSMLVIERVIDLLPIGSALEVVALVRSRIDAKEAELLAARIESGATDRSVESLLERDGKTSKSASKKRTKRAKAVNTNPGIAKKMASGQLSADQADVVADAAAKTNGDAARDEDLIKEISETTPDQARKVADEWVRKHTTAEEAQSDYDRARRRRSVRRWETDRDTHVLAIEGDESSIDAIELSIKTRSSQLYRADGGRSVPVGQHPRTRDQRNFDAAKELLTTGGPAPDDESAAPEGVTRRDRRAKKRTDKPSPRARVVVSMTVDQASGDDPSPARRIGGGILAPSVLERLSCNADFVGQIYDQEGELLWQGQSVRYFTDAQILGLIARDKGCVNCGAHYAACEAHHLIPWNSPARGPTDIDNGALVCSDCHHRIHDHNLILYRDSKSGKWKLRPATAAETPYRRAPEPDRPGKHKPKLHEHRRTTTLF